MNVFDITQHRLQQQYLLTPQHSRPGELVSWMGVVQAQDYAAAKWAIGQRLTTATDTMLDDAMGNWEIIRTHVLRPTWHFVAPADLRWMLKLSAPRVKALCAYNDKRWGVTPTVINKSQKVLEKILLGKKQLTRQEIVPAFQKTGIETDEYRLGSILVHAELDGLICSGPRQGKQFTYVLLEEHVPPAPALSKAESIATLAQRYFNSHGPATIHDFAWWSGLTITEAKSGLEAVKEHFVAIEADDKTYWMPPTKTTFNKSSVFLLPAYDEFTVAYKKRDIQQLQIDGCLAPMASLGPVIVADGQIIGTWKRTVNKKDISLELNPIKALKKTQQPALKKAIQHYSAFTGLPVAVK